MAISVDKYISAIKTVCEDCLYKKKETCNSCPVNKMKDIYTGEITRDMIEKGFDQGLVYIGWPNSENTVVCFIGSYWFYFGGETAENITPSKFLEITEMEDNINNILDVLKDFRDINPDEYFYYFHYLNENLK